MKYLFILSGVVCLSFMLLLACAPDPVQEAESVTEETPSTEADVAAIKAECEKFVVAWNSQDVEVLLSLYAEDAVRMPPNETEEVGKEAIRESFQRYFDEMTPQAKDVVVDVRASGDLAYARGAWLSTDTPKAGGEPVQDDSKWLEVLERQADGSWKIICEMWSANIPAPE